MSRFTYVEVYPSTGSPDRFMSWPESTPVKDAFLRASRPVCELYAEGLDKLDVQGYKSVLRLTAWFPEDQHGGRDPNQGPDEIHVVVWPEKPSDLPGEMGAIHASSSVGRLNARDRARLVLEVVHTAVRQLASYRDWDPAQFQSCYKHVLEQDFTYHWHSAWKASPDRRHRARAVYRLTADDGWGRVRLEIADRATGEVIAVSDEAVAFCTSKGFVRSAKTLAWSDSDRVLLLPYCGLLGDVSGHVTAVLSPGGWTFDVRDDVTVRPPGGTGLHAAASPAELPRVVGVSASRRG
ncbi:hypothetical protein GCM10009844_38940 [Nocardioides koreensis]|uniref:Uncharacterized protein n=1 Tax=Nocardioides koreensis TaxID=433651 RepID=A0ABP5LUA0_9ACTN